MYDLFNTLYFYIVSFLTYYFISFVIVFIISLFIGEIQLTYLLNSQHALIAMIERWKKSLDKKSYAGGVLMDLSKAFDTLNHDLLLAKLYAYGFEKSSLKLIHSYLKNRWQRTKINNELSFWIDLILGVPQGSILGPLFH